MCAGCLDLVDAVVRQPNRRQVVTSSRSDDSKKCQGHYPVCTYRRLRPDEVREWMSKYLPRTFTVLMLKEM